MTSLFRPISYYQDAPPAVFTGLDAFVADVPPEDAWPTRGGGAGRIGRSAVPLVHDRFVPVWRTPLLDAAGGRRLMLGHGRIVVLGGEQTGVWGFDGQSLGFFPGGVGAAFLDLAAERLLVADPPGVTTYSLDGRREGSLRLAAPGDGLTTEILQGPGALVLVTARNPPHGTGSVVVETARIRDYTPAANGTIYGVEPLAGIVRERDGRALAAASREGPVLAARGGIEWCNWRLEPQRSVELDGLPTALSVDGAGRAHLLVDHEGPRHLYVFSPTGAPLFDVVLPMDLAPYDEPPFVAADGQIFVTSPHAVLAISPGGQPLWRQDRDTHRLGTLTANGLLMLAGPSLSALTPEGHEIPLWQPPAPLVTPPVLVQGGVVVASADELFALAPPA